MKSIKEFENSLTVRPIRLPWYKRVFRKKHRYIYIDEAHNESVAVSLVTIAADKYNLYKDAYEILSELNTCNECVKRRDCKYIPDWGDHTRYNCPHFNEFENSQGEV